MPRVFNSTFENALRIILLLDAFGTAQNTDMLYATDFIVVYIAIGIDLDGKKDVLGMWVGENESAKFWATVLNSLKNRGVEDIFIACTDNLTPKSLSPDGTTGRISAPISSTPRGSPPDLYDQYHRGL